MKFLSCLKIPLTSMRFIASCENVFPRFQTSPILSFPPPLPDWSLHPLWRNSSTASAEEFYYSFYYNEGLENKLTRAPLLGLANSIYYYVNWRQKAMSLSCICQRLFTRTDSNSLYWYLKVWSQLPRDYCDNCVKFWLWLKMPVSHHFIIQSSVLLTITINNKK